MLKGFVDVCNFNVVIPVDVHNFDDRMMMLKNWEDRSENEFGFEHRADDIENLKARLRGFQGRKRMFELFRSILPIF